MISIGDALREERLRRGIKLEQVAAETKIDPYYLVAMEADHFDKVAVGTFFRRSFLRQYAHLLGLNEEELLGSLHEQFDEPEKPLPLPRPPKKPFHLPVNGAALWMLAVLACAALYKLDRRERLSSLGAAVRTTSVQVANRSSLMPSAGRMVSVNPSLPAVPSDEEAAPRGTRAMHAELTATEPVWLSINNDGVYSYTGTLDAHQNKQVDASNKLTVLIGNAGGMEVRLNGKSIGPLGARGETLLLVVTPLGFHIVRRAHTSPPSSPAPAEREDDTRGQNPL